MMFIFTLSCAVALLHTFMLFQVRAREDYSLTHTPPYPPMETSHRSDVPWVCARECVLETPLVRYYGARIVSDPHGERLQFSAEFCAPGRTRRQAYPAPAGARHVGHVCAPAASPATNRTPAPGAPRGDVAALMQRWAPPSIRRARVWKRSLR